MRWLDALRARLGLLFARRTAESRMNEEVHLHIDLEAEHVMREEGLTLTAIYSVTTCSVSRRTREIGIRVALGGSRRDVIGVILRRPLVEIVLGIAAGAVLVTFAFIGLSEATPSTTEAALIGAYAISMMVICLLACLIPTRRALGVEPAAVLTADR